jgi:hypothetical protein
LARFLVENGANVNAVCGEEDVMPLHLVRGKAEGLEEITQYLLSKGAKDTWRTDQPEELHVATEIVYDDGQGLLFSC